MNERRARGEGARGEERKEEAPPDSTVVLIGRIRAGDAAAREDLVARYLPILQRWARGRLPHHARSLLETSDLVQITIVRALDHLDTFEPRREGAFLAYLRQALMNQIRNEIRRSVHEPDREVSEDLPEERASLLEQMLGERMMEAYETGLAELPPRVREAVILSLEFGVSHSELALAIGSPSADAARMMVSRGLARLSKSMESYR
jgi:RNA polymerase sigma-70 factor (ECF subfamily)